MPPDLQVPTGLSPIKSPTDPAAGHIVRARTIGIVKGAPPRGGLGDDDS